MYLMVLLFLVIKVILELWVVLYLILVLINGVCGLINGMVCCCMLVFIKVWLELLFFKNGIYVEVMEIICFGEMFM